MVRDSEFFRLSFFAISSYSPSLLPPTPSLPSPSPPISLTSTLGGCRTFRRRGLARGSGRLKLTPAAHSCVGLCFPSAMMWTAPHASGSCCHNVVPWAAHPSLLTVFLSSILVTAVENGWLMGRGYSVRKGKGLLVVVHKLRAVRGTGSSPCMLTKEMSQELSTATTMHTLRYSGTAFPQMRFWPKNIKKRTQFCRCPHCGPPTPVCCMWLETQSESRGWLSLQPASPESGDSASILLLEEVSLLALHFHSAQRQWSPLRVHWANGLWRWRSLLRWHLGYAEAFLSLPYSRTE